MNITVNIITIAIKFDDSNGRYHYSIDTYARINAGENFIENFMNEYSGNGIESVTILQNDVKVICIECFRDLEKLANTLRDTYPGINETILDY